MRAQFRFEQLLHEFQLLRTLLAADDKTDALIDEQITTLTKANMEVNDDDSDN